MGGLSRKMSMVYSKIRKLFSKFDVLESRKYKSLSRDPVSANWRFGGDCNGKTLRLFQNFSFGKATLNS
jgi:hypothetical protein